MSKFTKLVPEVPPTLREVTDFLDGSAPLLGVWFGDNHPDYFGAQWWRPFLNAALQAAPSADGEVVYQVRRDISEPFENCHPAQYRIYAHRPELRRIVRIEPPKVVDVSKLLIAIETAGYQMANYESTVASDAYDPVAAGSRRRDFKSAIAALKAALEQSK